uniref:Uncharacterized protein n=1 Tax=Caenorhabditis japonica TaxID=281687 RepID=A0A8R1I8J4_CAEJA
MDYHCDTPLVLTLLKSDFVGINQLTNCADNFPFIRFTGSTTAVSPTASIFLKALREDSADRPYLTCAARPPASLSDLASPSDERNFRFRFRFRFP